MRVRVLVSTFNGEQHLREQLESIADQTYTDFDVLIRDDGSVDRTEEIIESFTSLDSRFRRLTEASPLNLGPCQSFASLIGASLDRDILLFCDQDDVWMREKVARTVSVFARQDPRRPVAVHSDLQVVDKDLGTLDESMKAGTQALLAGEESQFAALLAQNFVTGCALAINQSLAREVLPIPPEALMHDWWIALVAAARGGLIYLPEPLVLYRQHGKNVSGPAARLGLWKGLKKLTRSRRDFQDLMRSRIRQSLALERHLGPAIDNPQARMLREFHEAIARSWSSAVRFAIRNGVRMDDLARTATYYLLLAAGDEDHKSLVLMYRGGMQRESDSAA